jgi:hypothetical protein
MRAVLVATSALASAVLTTTAHAGDAAWNPQNNSGNFNDGANWVGNAVPDGTATFNASSQQTISFSQETNTRRHFAGARCRELYVQ